MWYNNATALYVVPCYLDSRIAGLRMIVDDMDFAGLTLNGGMTATLRYGVVSIPSAASTILHAKRQGWSRTFIGTKTGKALFDLIELQYYLNKQSKLPAVSNSQ